LDRFAAVMAPNHRFKIGPGGGRDLLPGDVGLKKRRAQGAGIDDQNLVAAAPDVVRDKGVFLALGVHRAENRNGGHDCAASLAGNPPAGKENLELKKSGKDDLFATALATVEVLAREELAPLPAFPEFLTSK
jgi:hypothetical protein